MDHEQRIRLLESQIAALENKIEMHLSNNTILFKSREAYEQYFKNLCGYKEKHSNKITQSSSQAVSESKN